MTTQPLTISQAADSLGCSTANLRQAIKRGALAATKFGPRLYLISAEEVERYRCENLGRIFGR